MSLKEQDRQVMVVLHLEKADKMLTELDVMLQTHLWGLAANRLYYALFHAVCAMLTQDRQEVGTHRGAVGRFGMLYVKSGLFTPEEGHLYARLQGLREDGDYNCSIDVSQQDIECYIEPTRQLIAKIKRYIAGKSS